MIGQKQKPLKDILKYLEGKKRIVLIGCGGCAVIFRTGGEEDLDRRAKELEENDKEIIAKIALPLNTFACYLPMSSRYLRRNLEKIKTCDAILNLSCGDGLQVIRGYLETQDVYKPIYPGVDSMGVVGEGPEKFNEKCQGCGDCRVSETAGICPLTQCPKSLMNGPCGGLDADGNCEVDPETKCVWNRILERMERMGDLDRHMNISKPRDWHLAEQPRKLKTEQPLRRQRILNRR